MRDSLSFFVFASENINDWVEMHTCMWVSRFIHFAERLEDIFFDFGFVHDCAIIRWSVDEDLVIGLIFFIAGASTKEDFIPS